jgi:hypothetical protein
MAAGTIGSSVFPLKVEILVSFPHNTELVFRIFDRKFAHLALEPAHLDTFLNGVTADEPPTYKHFNDATILRLRKLLSKRKVPILTWATCSFRKAMERHTELI